MASFFDDFFWLTQHTSGIHLYFILSYISTSLSGCTVFPKYQPGKEVFGASLFFFKQTYNIMINVVALDHLGFEQNLENFSVALRDRI